MKGIKKEDYPEYIPCPPYTYSTYAPWFKVWFQKIYNKIKDHTIVKEDRCYMLYRFSEHCSFLNGDFAECGVYKGGTAYLIADTLLKNTKKRKILHLFDTFSGMPALANQDPGVLKEKTSLKEGALGDITLNEVKEYLKQFQFINFHQGIIPETFREVKSKKFAFVHIDVDLYQTSKDCCKYFYNRMVKGGVMIFDDYGFPQYIYSEKQAVDEFFSDKPESPISLRTGQCMIIKR